jgi:gluconolactonase
MYRLRSRSMSALCGVCLVIMVLGPMPHSPALADTTMAEICGTCQAEVFAKGGKFLEGPAFDTAGNLWVVSIQSGAVSQITADDKRTDVFNTGGQPQGLKFHKDGRLFGVDRKRGVFSYDPKTQTLSDYVLYFQNENFHGPNDLIFDRQGGIYFTELKPRATPCGEWGWRSQG